MFTNFIWSFKVNELLPALDKRIEEKRKELKEATKPVTQEVDDNYAKVAGFAAELGVPMPRITTIHNRARTPDSSMIKNKLEQYKRLRALFEREDPHRQYKLHYEDVVELGLISLDEEEV